jgi:hypothetical protein
LKKYATSKDNIKKGFELYPNEKVGIGVKFTTE